MLTNKALQDLQKYLMSYHTESIFDFCREVRLAVTMKKNSKPKQHLRKKIQNEKNCGFISSFSFPQAAFNYFLFKPNNLMFNMNIGPYLITNNNIVSSTINTYISFSLPCYVPTFRRFFEN